MRSDSVGDVPNQAGSIAYELSEDPAAHTVLLGRKRTIAKSTFQGAANYAALQAIYRETVAGDAESLILTKQ